MHIIGAGRVGGALTSAAHDAGQHAVLLARDSDWSVLDKTTDPVIVATRNDDLDDVVQRVPAHRHADLVFVQNGMLRPWLDRHGMSHNTRGLLFFAVPSRGAAIQPGPPSPFVGTHAQTVADWMRAIQVPAERVSASAFTDLEHEKLLWNTAFGLCCQALDATVGEVVQTHHDTLVALVTELDAVARHELDVSVPVEELVQRLCAYSMTIPDYQGAVKEWAWRNGWYVEVAERHALAMPVHTSLCART